MLNVIAGLLNGAGAPASTNSYESIATTTVGAGGTSTVTFSSIPSTYKHLQIRYLAINTSGPNFLTYRFNSDTGSNYFTYHILNGDGGGTASAGAGATGTYIWGSRVYAPTIPGAGVVDILDYQNTNKNKVTRSLGGYDANGGGQVDFTSGLWMSTSAINRIDITFSQGGNFAQYSSIALYGIKG